MANAVFKSLSLSYQSYLLMASMTIFGNGNCEATVSLAATRLSGSNSGSTELINSELISTICPSGRVKYFGSVLPVWYLLNSSE